MYDELVAYIGLIIYELDEKIYKDSQYDTDYMFYESKKFINTIKSNLKEIQQDLINNNLQDISYIDKWTLEFKDHTKTLPYGHCFVASSICDRFKDIQYIEKLKIFLENLGYFLNSNIYFIE
jgi:hypothetical protein